MLTRRTSLTVGDLPFVTHEGHEAVVVVVKATFEKRGDALRLSDEQAPIRVADVLYDSDAEQSSVRLPSDLVPEKHGADVVVVGAALSSEPVRTMDVAVGVGDHRALARVHGERVFYRGATGVVVSDAAPFTSKPIVYERAYGGTSVDHSIVERRNPVGRGVANDPSELVDTPAPQIEDPRDPITHARSAKAPVGLGAIPMSWEPRTGFAGTLDDTWQRERMPLMPADFDLRFHNCAHPSLVLKERLAAGTTLAVTGMSLDDGFVVTIPSLPVRIVGRYDHQSLELRPSVDTAILFPNDQKIELSLRACLRLGRGAKQLRAIEVADG